MMLKHDDNDDDNDNGDNANDGVVLVISVSAKP